MEAVWIILICLGAFALALTIGAYFGNGKYTYQFQERTVTGDYLEAARRKLNDYHSPLIETNDPCII